MESVTFTMRQAAELHPMGESCADQAFRRGTIHQFSILEDGTAVVLREVSGDLDCARRLLETHDTTLGYSVSGGSEGEGLAYVHADPPGWIAEVVKLPRRYELVVDFPLEGVGENAIRVTMISEDRAILQQALADIPDEVDITIERIGAYSEEMADLTAVLTSRQQEILDVATDLGYYDVPRQATHEDIAKETGLAASTVSEHMQKIEARAFSALAG
ncbi:MAG: helix-turn-helix domain-containing protein [Halobacteriales archaeon]|nr:helix-turn-helix domain-containing protein [Halobacteriales archaeon]